MPAKAERDPIAALTGVVDTRQLFRLLAWGLLAACAVLGAVAAARSEAGTRRIAQAFGGAGAAASPAPARVPAESASGVPVAETQTRPVPDAQARALTEAVHRLAGERDRLIARLDALERSVERTGSLAPVEPKAPDPPSPQPHANARAPAAAALAQPRLVATTSVRPPPAPPPESKAPAAAAAETGPVPENPAMPAAKPAGGPQPAMPEYAVDLGAEPNAEAARALWLSVKAQQGALLDGLQARIAAHAGRAGKAEMRLLAGPLNNPDMGSRICAVLRMAGRSCQTATFEGQRLAFE